jgi:dihydroorotate dehydrogenase (fumarate)
MRTDLSTATSYMGLKLAHPFIAGASPLSAALDSVRRLEDGGAAAIVLHSLFEEQITEAQTGRIRGLDPTHAAGAAQIAAFPSPDQYPFSPDEHLEHLRQVKAAVAIPVIASLNGTTGHAWLKYAQLFEQAGADGLEINFYDVVANLAVPGITIETQIRDLVIEVKRSVRLPVAMKLSPFFTAFGNVARRLDEAGADGLVIFNRFLQPDIDTDALTAQAIHTLSSSAELLLRLRWLAILHGRVRTSLAVTGGVHTPTDGVKAVLAGAHAVQMVSALLINGADHLRTMRDGLADWLDRHEVASVQEMRGRVSLQSAPDASDFERANYIHTLHRWTE